MDVLDTLPDLSDWEAVEKKITFTNTFLDSLDSSMLAQDKPLTRVSYTPSETDNPLGVYGDKRWRKFAFAVFLADCMCYTKPEDKADFSRTLSVVSTFFQGFDVYFAESIHGIGFPVGYTGWYPIIKDVYNMMEHAPEKLTHRGMILPLRELGNDGDNYLYLFNYSIAEPLIGTPYSAQLIKDYTNTLATIPHKGRAAVTVSSHGKRIAEKFGMSYTGDMTHMGDKEAVYCGLNL